MPHTLPPLPYDYNALEPHIDEATMRLHHDKHHQSYVDGLNAAEKKLADARASGDYAGMKAAWKEVGFHGGGHFMHCIFWENMAPAGQGGAPSAALAAKIEEDFGSLENLKKEFCAAGVQVEGSGWAVLAYRASDGKLLVHQTEKHQDLVQPGLTPLLVCDVWEHAYYLNYQNRRPEYVENFWQVVNWADVSTRFEGKHS